MRSAVHKLPTLARLQVVKELDIAKSRTDVAGMEAAIKQAVVWLSTAAGLQAPGVAQASLGPVHIGCLNIKSHPASPNNLAGRKM